MAVRVFSVEFRSAIAQRILGTREERAVFEHGVQDQAKHTLPLARRVSLGGQGWFQEDAGPAAGWLGAGYENGAGCDGGRSADSRVGAADRSACDGKRFFSKSLQASKGSTLEESAPGEARCTEK